MLNKFLDHLEEWLIAALIAAATAVTFVAVIHRYGSSNSANLMRWARLHEQPWLFVIANWAYTQLHAMNVSWAQELSTYMFIWMAKFGAALGVRTGIHVGVDVLVDCLHPRGRKPVVIFAMLCGALFTGIIGTLGAIYVYELDPDQVSQELEWQSWLIYLCIPLGSYLMSFRFLQVAWHFARTGDLPHHDPKSEAELVVKDAAEATR